MAFDPGRVRAIFFDVDGTLSDTDDVYAATVARWLVLLPSRMRADVARRIVLALETPANFAYAVLDRLGWDGAMRWLSARLRRRRVGEAAAALPVIAGVPEMLAALAGRYPLAIVSARGRPMVQDFLERHRLAPWFGAVVTAESCARTKPSPEPLRFAAAMLGVPVEGCVMVGDTTVDMRAARAAGAQAIGVLCGFGVEGELRRSGADAILASTADVGGLLG